MPFGLVPAANRLGIANNQTPLVNDFAINVLRLPTNIPIYQQQIVHSLAFAGGPTIASADWKCATPDINDINQVTTLREVSAHDNPWARRNISHAPTTATGYDVLRHSDAYYNQIYYVVNEPDGAGPLLTVSVCDPGNWEQRDYGVDGYISSAISGFPNATPDIRYWELEPVSSLWRVMPKALAYTFLKLKQAIEGKGRGHIVLPPAATNAMLSGSNVQTFWSEFFGFIHGPVGSTLTYESGPAVPRITPASLGALHLHLYAVSPGSTDKYGVSTDWWAAQGIPSPSGLMIVANSIAKLRKGANWYRTNYGVGGQLAADVLISETGEDYGLGKVDITLRWRAGFSTHQEGMAWWNSWLCFLTRNATSQLGLQSPHVVHSCIHEPSILPVSTTRVPDTTINQKYLNVNSWLTATDPSAPAFLTGGSTSGRFPNKFSSYGGGEVVWPHPAALLPYATYYRTPHGACLYTWHKVAVDGVTENINTGWVSLTTSAGVIAQGTINVPVGYNTVYFPVIKDMGNSTSGDLLSIQWLDSSAQWKTFGTIDQLFDYQNSQTFQWVSGYVPVDITLGVPQPVYSAVVLPVVVRATSAGSRTFRIHRAIGGTRVWLGKPQILPGVCSWMTPHANDMI